MQTMTFPDGTEVPVAVADNFLVDFGPTSRAATDTWLEQYRAVLNAYGKATWGIPVPVEVMARGKTGRTVLRIWAPDPAAAVLAAETQLDDGPKVVIL